VCQIYFTLFWDMFEGVPNFIRVTWPRPRPFSGFLYVRLGEIVNMHPCAKFQVCNFSHFADMFEGVSNFIVVTWLRQRRFSGFSFVRFGEIVHVHPYAKFQVCSFTGIWDMFDSVPNLGSRDACIAPFMDFYLTIFEKLSTCTCAPNLNSVALLVFQISLRVCQIL